MRGPNGAGQAKTREQGGKWREGPMKPRVRCVNEARRVFLAKVTFAKTRADDLPAARQPGSGLGRVHAELTISIVVVSLVSSH
jgi:hypothetical protein